MYFAGTKAGTVVDTTLVLLIYMIYYCDESQLLSEGSAATTGVGCCWEDCYKLLHLLLESKNNCL
jgi:hypothetical protein